MKWLTILVILLWTSEVSAQDPQLYEHTWYLEDLVLNGNSFPPSKVFDPGVVQLFFNDDQLVDFETIVCQFANAELIYDNPSSSFLFSTDLNTGGIQCDPFSVELEYERIYFDFFQIDINDPFEYEIIPNGDEILLIITSIRGDTAHYSNQILGQKDEQALNLLVYPNPTSDMLYLQSRQEILNVTLYDLSGKKIPVDLDSANNSIDISNLTTGFYLLQIELAGYTVTKTVIKRL